MVEIELVRSDGLAQVGEFYKAAGYGGGVSEDDVTLAAKSGGRMVGVVRLCTEEGVVVLRGMQVAPAFQRQGVLGRCIPYLEQGVAYCLPYEHLVRFYGQAGFTPAAPEELPAFLARRLAAYIASGQRVLAMRWGESLCPAIGGITSLKMDAADKSADHVAAASAPQQT
jgi:GNAT superfamily N-acetyltransferase